MQLLHCVTKSKAAFLLSANRMFESYPAVYFWTFTFTKCHPDWWYPIRWNDFMKDLQNNFGKTIYGLRVIEVHPGEYSHGLHYHALLNRRLSWHIVRRIAKRHDIGRLSVEKADENSAIYLSKYLSKENELTAGMRKWGTIGNFQAVKNRNIKCESILADNIRWIQDKTKVLKFSYAFFLWVSKQTTIHGPIADWPVTQCNYIKPSKMQVLHVKDVELPDDDGITYYDLKPFKTKFEKLKPIRIKGEYGYVDVLVPCVPSERLPF